MPNEFWVGAGNETNGDLRGPGELNSNYSGGLGIPGYGNSSSCGTIGTGTFDPRQIVMQARVIF